MGDGIADQLEQLKTKVCALETQLGKVAKSLELSYSQIANQLGGTLALPSPFSSNTQIGGAYEAVGGTASAGPSVH